MREFWQRASLPSLKNGGNLVDLVNKKSYKFSLLCNFPGKQQHSNVVNGKLVYNSRGEPIFFRTKSTLRRFANSLFPRGTKKISIRRHNFPTNPLHISLIYKQTTEYISKRASQQAGEHCFFNSELPKKNSCLPSTA